MQDGCNGRCAYCIVPLARGRSVSRDSKEIVSEAERLVAAGHEEIVLVGIHLGVYGRDLSPSLSLARLVRKLLRVKTIRRLRLSSIEATEVEEDLLDLMASDERLCPHLHLPLQSGDGEILRMMRRPYTASQYMKAIDHVRSKLSEPSFTTDIMIGFPGETEEEFRNTLRVCEEVGFSRMHIFPFSPRPGTAAAELPGRLPAETVRRRVDEARQLAAELALAYKRRFVGRLVEPLVESRRELETQQLVGYTSHYLTVRFPGPDTLKGRIVPVMAKKATPAFLEGSLRGDARPGITGCNLRCGRDIVLGCEATTATRLQSG